MAKRISVGSFKNVVGDITGLRNLKSMSQMSGLRAAYVGAIYNWPPRKPTRAQARRGFEARSNQPKPNDSILDNI